MREGQLRFVQLHDVGGLEQVGDERRGIEALSQVHVVDAYRAWCAAITRCSTARAALQEGNSVP